LDLGCRDGFLGHFIYNLYPNSREVFIDISKKMIDKAKEKDNKSQFFVKDFGQNNWQENLNGKFSLTHRNITERET